MEEAARRAERASARPRRPSPPASRSRSNCAAARSVGARSLAARPAGRGGRARGRRVSRRVRAAGERAATASSARRSRTPRSMFSPTRLAAPATVSSPTTRPGRDVDGVADNVRRLHLNAIQFYDWMYRHARAAAARPTTFVDALGRRAVARHRAPSRRGRSSGAGSLPLGYAAVYAAGGDGVARRGRRTACTAPNGAAVDARRGLPLERRPHERALARALRRRPRAAPSASVGFAGFHLDQYGAPEARAALRRHRVSTSRSVPGADRHASPTSFPSARLIFNNVNDFPTWSTATRHRRPRSTSRSGPRTTGSPTSPDWWRRRTLARAGARA